MTEPATVRNPDLHRRALAIELGVVLLVAWLPMVVAGSMLRGEPRPDSIASELYGVVTYIGVLALLLYLLWRNHEPWRHLGLRRTRWWSELLWAALIYVACWTSYILISRWAQILHVEPSKDGAFPSNPGRAYLVVLPFLVLMGAVFEEVLVRGYLWNRLQRLTGSKAAALVGSSLLFAAYHPYHLFGLVYVFSFGLVLGFFRWKGRSLPRLILAHTLFNLSIAYL